MKVIDWLKNVRYNLIAGNKKSIESFNSETNVDLDAEFEAELEEHEIREGNIFKLHYINYHRIGHKKMLGMIDWPLEPFMIPDGMSREHAFKVLSYLTDYIETNADVEEASLKSVRTLNEVLDLPRFGFRRVKNKVDAISLYTVTGRIEKFKNSPYYDTYFEWYVPDVTRDEVVEIYELIGMTFSDIVFKDKEATKKLTAHN